jgi:hypothetical protein
MPKAQPQIQITLDSGAFGSWTRQEPIRIEDYIPFVHECAPYLHSYINLDCIPSKKGRPRTFSDVEVAAETSFRNLQTMRAAGLQPMAVFHQGERIEWLQKMLADGTDIIGISTAKNYRRLPQQQWLDIVFSVLTDDEGRPLVRIHGLGIGHYDWLQRYPFYSTDSSGWVIAAVNGKCYVPPYRHGVPNYLGQPELVTLSGRYQKGRYNQSRQLANPTRFGPHALADIEHFVTEICGLTMELVRSEHWARAQMNGCYYQGVKAALPTPIRFYHKVALRSDELRLAKRLQATRSAFEVPALEFIFATQKDWQWRRALRAVGAQHHLLSFANVRRPDVLAAYAMGGKVVAKRQARRRMSTDPACRPGANA